MPNKNGLELIKPTSIASTGTGNSSSINTNGSVTFSTCATLSLNGVFSADYDNYMIVARHNASTTSTFRARLRSSGTDATASDYTYQVVEVYDTTVAGRRDSSQGQFVYGPGGYLVRAGHIIWFYGPHLAQPTATRNISTGPWSSGGYPGYIIDVAGTHSPSTSYDGVTVFPSGGTLSGLIAVYGMRK